LTYKQLVSHPVTRRLRSIIKAIVATCAVILAVAIVATITMDLGPALREQAEQQASTFLKRPMHIGRLGVHLLSGTYVLEDVVIEGLTPDSRPFLTAGRIDVSMLWNTLKDRRVVFDEIEMTDWQMYAESLPGGGHNFPNFTRSGPRGQSNWTVTVAWVRAHRGEFTYEDHGTPWSVVTRNLDVTVSRPAGEYRGQATFSNGTVAFQQYVPFRIDMTSNFTIDGGLVRFDSIDLDSDGAETRLTGVADIGRWPEMTYQMRSAIDFPAQKAIWFAKDDFTVVGDGEFVGTLHMFKETLPSGATRTGRELEGTLTSGRFGVNGHRFGDLRGSVLWIPEALEFTDATATAYGGRSRFDYTMAPLGRPGVRATATFDADYADIDLTALTDFFELEGIRLAGRATGRNLLQWPLGRFAEMTSEGTVQVAPPPDVTVMTRDMPLDRIAAREAIGRPLGPFSPHTPVDPVPVGGEISYAMGRQWIDIGPSRVATPDTYVEFEGRTAYGTDSRIPFHVTSADWQESDRLLAGLMTAFGARTGAIPIGGYGTFDGVMLNEFRRPRIEGTFAGEQMRAFDVVWGSARGTAVIENSYADVTGVVLTAGDSTIRADGRFSVGFPRRDGGEEINAILRLDRRAVADLRQAFGIADYDVDGLLSGEFHIYGNYRTPQGFGSMAITDGVAYGESFERATAAVRLEGTGVRLDGIELLKGGGRGTGAAYVGWNGTYSFNMDARNIAVEAIDAAKNAPLPLSGLLDFNVGGSGTFDLPRYDVRGTIRDLFAADEGIGQVVGTISIAGDLMTLKVEAASPRLAVSGAGRIALTPEMDAELTINVADTSLDPYVRAFEPRLSPFTTAVASGTIRVVGELANVDRLRVDATVDRFDASLFDYAIRNAAPIRIALDRHSVRVADMRLVGQDTQIDVSGLIDLHDERIAIRATGDANLGILQAFASNMRSTGRAVLSAALEGPLREPFVSGTMTVDNGRIRHFDLPHALESISGVMRFDTRSIRLDDLSARLGGGPVEFGGSIGFDGYRPGRLDVTMTGSSMVVRFPEGMRSTIDAELALQGTVESATLTGEVIVREGEYTRAFDTGGGFLDLPGSAPQLASTSIETTIPLRYDVRVSAPSTLEVRNNNLQLLASADLQLRGTYDRPLLFGRAQIARGDVLFEGKRYIVTRGTIDFNNPTRIEPFFDLEAETRVRVPRETYVVTLTFVGTFNRLEMQAESEPFLPEIEVLALLFSDIAPGQDIEFRRYGGIESGAGGITPQEQLVRDQAARALTGVISSPVGRAVEQTFGVDTFQLTPSLVNPNEQSSRLDPAARVTIGKRLSERVFLTYSRSLTSSTRDQIILLEYDQSDRFSWVLSRNEDRTYALDFRFRRNF
jgi:hypothetical protein